MCTYVHDLPGERCFLTCAICGSEKDQGGEPIISTEEIKDSEDLSPPPPKKQRRSSWSSLLRSPVSGTPVVVRRGTCVREIGDVELLEPEYPVYLERDVLDNDLATRLLEALHQEAQTWEQGQWVVHGKTHKTPRTTRKYVFADDEVPAAMLEARNAINRRVQERYPFWTATMVLGNRYKDGNDSVAAHSDFLNDLGPRAVVAGLSLGAERTFRVTGDLRIDVPTPHNSLIVMKPGCQEDYKHEVPRTSTKILEHDQSTVRFSLTFRMQRQDVITECNKYPCHCGKPPGLKSQGGPGKYFLFCNPAGASAESMCAFRKRCVWAEDDAKRLLRAEDERSSSLRGK